MIALGVSVGEVVRLVKSQQPELVANVLAAPPDLTAARRTSAAMRQPVHDCAFRVRRPGAAEAHRVAVEQPGPAYRAARAGSRAYQVLHDAHDLKMRVCAADLGKEPMTRHGHAPPVNPPSRATASLRA
jgi:hypothetical protein